MLHGVYKKYYNHNEILIKQKMEELNGTRKSSRWRSDQIISHVTEDLTETEYFVNIYKNYIKAIVKH